MAAQRLLRMIGIRLHEASVQSPLLGAGTSLSGRRRQLFLLTRSSSHALAARQFQSVIRSSLCRHEGDFRFLFLPAGLHC